MLARDAFRSGRWHTIASLFRLVGVPAAQAITQTSTQVTWTMTEVCSGRVEYGLTSAYGSQTNEQPISGGFSTHVQTITGLSSGTTYHFRTRSTSAAGVTIFSEDQEFTTAGQQVVSATGPQPAPFVPSGSGVVVLPSSIADDGSGNVAAAINSFLNGVPVGSTVVFDQTLSHQGKTAFDAKGSVYRILSAIVVPKRLTLWGYGSRIQCDSTTSSETAGGFNLNTAASGSRILGFEVAGNNGTSGTITAWSGTSGERPHGVSLIGTGVADVEVADTWMHHLRGDGIWKSAYDTAPHTACGGYWIHHNRIEMTGRQGVVCNLGSPTAANPFGWKIEWNEIWDIALYPIDAEDSRDLHNVLNGTYILDNDFRRWNWEANASFSNHAHVISIGYWNPSPDGTTHQLGSINDFYVERNRFGSGQGDGPMGHGGIFGASSLYHAALEGVVSISLHNTALNPGNQTPKANVVVRDNVVNVDASMRRGRWLSITNATGVISNNNTHPGMNVSITASSGITGNDT